MGTDPRARRSQPSSGADLPKWPRTDRRLVGGGILASLGAEMQAVAVGWEIYQRTGSPGHLGLVGLVQFLPVLCLALPAGHAADRQLRIIGQRGADAYHHYIDQRTQAMQMGKPRHAVDVM